MIKINQTDNNRKARVVYILAASHSGSTLTALLLNSHPQVCSTGELKVSNLDHPESYRCSCRQLIHECEFWRRVTVAMRERGAEFNVLDAKMSIVPTGSDLVDRLIRPLHRGPLFEWARDCVLNVHPTWRNFSREWARRNLALVQSISSVSSADFVVDSSKTGMRLKYLRRIPGLEVKTIRLKRDGRGVALTYMNSDEFADATEVAWRGGGTGPTNRPKLRMREAALRWLRSNQEADAVVNSIPDRDVIEISYEDLCLSTSQTLSQIFEFLGLESNANFEEFRSAPHHVVGNGMRLDVSSKIVLDERWKDVLTPQDCGDFEKIAGKLNKRYGYT